MLNEVSIFDGFIPYYKITKPVRLIELFAGIGSQHQALKNLGVKIDRSTIVEWQVNSIQAYNDIHIRKYDDYTQGLSKEELAYRLHELGVSIDYNQPAKLETLNRKGEEWLRNVYNNVINTNNKVNIMSVKGSHLNITDTDKYDYIMTYSFPCQDLSKAGKGKGMSDTTTRSGLLWEVERILSELKEKPQVLLMENVPDVIGSKFIKDFQRWEERLRELGYSNHIEVLNSKHYGIPQNRERAFMVSILGNYQYRFPQPIPLTLRLKDMLEKEVDEKYYISEKLMGYFTNDGTGKYPRRERFIQNIGRENQDIANAVTTLPGQRPVDNFVGDTKEFANYLTWKDSKGRLNTQDHRAYFEDRLSGTVPAMERGTPNVLLNNLRIRKLTPRECYRLMGFGDEAFDLASKNQSNSSLYHQAGDSIVVNVLEAIFKELL